MAKKLNINNEWRAFVPIANIAVLGKIADSYSKDEKKPTKYGKLLYVLYIIEIFLAIVFLILTLSSLIYLLKNVEVAIENNTALTKDMFSTFIPVIVVYFILLAVAVIYTVFYNIVLWKIYSMFSKKNAVMFLILSILFGFLTPVLLLIISNNNPVFKRTDENSAIFNLEGEI